MKFSVAGILLASLSQPVHGDGLPSKINWLLKTESKLNRNYDKSSDGSSVPREEKMRCKLWENCIQYEDESKVEHRWECTFDEEDRSGFINKRIVGLNNFDVTKFLEANGAVSGMSELVLADMDESKKKIRIRREDVISVDPIRGDETSRRKLAYPSDGKLETLVVKINTKDTSSPSSSALSSNIFFDPFCLKSQYENCSFDQLTVIPYSTENSTVPVTVSPSAPGVIDVTVDVFASQSNTDQVQNLANQAVRNLFQTINPGFIFDAVMFCMPAGLGDYLAYAYVGRWDSYYNDEWCLKLSAQMHEVGHNLGLQHSGEYTGSDSVQEYGDQSDMMGFSYFEDDSPQMCFNPAKNWQLGWYADKSLELTVANGLLTNEGRSFTLNGFVDYESDTPDRYITLKIEDYYIGFNRAKDFNSQVREAANLVTIVEKQGTPESFTKSKSAAKLAVGDTYFINTGFLRVEVKYVENVDGDNAVVEIILPSSESCDDNQKNGEIEVVIVTDQFPGETSWGVADATGQYVFQVPSDSYNQQFTQFTQTVSDLCRGYEYFFIIEDTFGDGICCGFGQGSYQGFFEGDLIFEGGGFAQQDVKAFTLPLIDTPCTDDDEFTFALGRFTCEDLSNVNEGRRQRLCNREQIRNNCRETCGNCN